MIVKIKNVTLADFNVDPDHSEGDLSTREMKFEARMLCSVQEYVSERSQYSAIHVAYIRGKWQGGEGEQRSESREREKKRG